MYKAIFIDIDNTLLDFNLCAKITIERILAEYNIEFEERMFDVFLRINDGLWKDIEKGLLTKEGLYKIRWNTIFNELGIKLDGVEFEQKFVLLLKDAAEPVTYADEILKYLSSKYPVYAASNGAHEQQVLRLTKAGMIDQLSGIFTSERFGFPKPSEAFFDKCFAELEDIKPEEVMLIGDSLTADIYGGVSYGLKTCWFNYKGETVPDNINTDYIVTALKEIEDIL